MKEVEFKFGDLVYFPIQTHKVLKLIENYYESSKECYPFMFEGDKHTILTELGTFEYGDLLPPIFHATQENYELLSKLYPNVEFEQPPKRKESREIIKAMLKAGYDGVPCKTECGRYRYICTGIIENEFFSFKYANCANECSAYSSGIPYYPKTGQKIIDFIDGKCVLENGEVVLENEND